MDCRLQGPYVLSDTELRSARCERGVPEAFAPTRCWTVRLLSFGDTAMKAHPLPNSRPRWASTRLAFTQLSAARKASSARCSSDTMTDARHLWIRCWPLPMQKLWPGY